MIGTQAMSNNRSLSYQSRNFHLIIFDFFQWTYIVDRINFVSPPICDTACDFNINHTWVFLQYIFTLPAFGFYPNKKDSKTSLPKRLIMSDLILDGILLHNAKAPSPIVVTLFGIFMFVRDSHPLKAFFPIVLTLFGIFMVVREVQKWYLQLIEL